MPRSCPRPDSCKALTMEYRHTPVLLAEVTQHLPLQPGSVIVDCTLGGAGHARRIQELVEPGGVLVGIDRDRAAIDAARSVLRLGQQAILLQGDFGELDELLTRAGIAYADGILMDLGVSSPQLDAAERGFSYRDDAPLDMRMDPGGGGITAAEVVNTYSQEELARIIREFGEERWAPRIAAHIVAARGRRPILTTLQLADIAKEAIPAAARRTGPHPARRTFQALRMEVNRELEALERGLEAAVRWLRAGGRVAVISYHSLEDRIVKRAFAALARGCTCPPGLPVCRCGQVPVVRIVTPRPVVPTAEEVARNPRSRSAKLRVAEKV
ncbi:MAG: 16S rRNA (cytosine(1402)-N(4))-methyltransferase RsmH [Coriobacteriia bacterium]|nr:16S rRNA (cytosine(1402)-N(4))-methyltransferase RsmH [Coriobacteriia bacterium]